MKYFKHESAIVESEKIGDGTRVEANAHIPLGAVIGANCIISDGVYISKNVVIHDNVEIGQNSFVAEGAIIHRNTKIGACSVVEKTIPPFSVARGNPIIITDYIHTKDCDVSGVTEVKFKAIKDTRGKLIFGEFGREIPFNVKRFFNIYDVKHGYSRGDHAHKKCHQFIICQKGSVDIVFDDGTNRNKITLSEPNIGMHVGPGVWTSLYNFSDGASVNVFASEYYEDEDYIRDYDSFTSFKNV